MILALIASLSSPAFAVDIQKTGNPQQDRIFLEVTNTDRVLDAADARMDALIASVATAMGLQPDTPLETTVFQIKQAAGGKIRIMVADDRPILALAPDSPEKAKAAASLLNEGTQEVGVIARDLGKVAGRMRALITNSEDGPTEGASNKALNQNRKATDTTATRAEEVTARAAAVIQAVKDGVSASAPTADTPAKADTAPAATGPNPVRALIDSAWVQFEDAELDEASKILANADSLLPRQTVLISRRDLNELFQLRSLVALVRGEATAAAWSAAQVLVVDPNAKPLERMGPQYAKLHQALQQADLVSAVEVKMKAKTNVMMSGVPMTNGERGRFGKGQHLMQMQDGDVWKSTIVTIDDGFVIE